MAATESNRKEIILESRTLDLNKALNLLLDQVVRKMRIDAARIYLCDVKNKDLRFATGTGFNNGKHNGESVHYGSGLVGYVALRRRPFVIADLSHPRNTLNRNSSIENEGFIFYCGIPFFSEGCLQGVLEVFCRQSVDLNSEWISLLSVQAERISGVIENTDRFNHILNVD